MSTKQGIGVKIKNGISELKNHWDKPKDGYYVSYKEFLLFSVGLGSPSFMSILITWTGIAVNIPLMLSYFKVSTGFVFLAGIIGSILGLVRAPILSMIIDNSNSKKGKFKPFLPWTSIATALSFGVIPFIPEAWIENTLFAIHIPEMSFFGVSASNIDITLGSLVMFILIQLGTFFNTLLSQCLIGIEQTISPVSQERANIGAFKGLICYIPSSIVNIILPLVAGVLVKGTSNILIKENPMNNVELYRWTFPICGILAVIFVFFIYFGAEERAVVNKKYVAKVNFFDGAKQLLTNKYFWIITIFNISFGVRGNINIFLWICNYAIGGQKGATVLAICNIVLNNAFVPGMLLGPILIKKFGKKNVMLASTIGFTIMAFMQLFTLNNPYLILVAIFFQNIFNGLSYIATIMVPDVLDYQQWKTGKRLEGFWQNCSAFITTIFGLLTSSLLPFVMSLGGVGFGDNIDIALRDAAIRHDTFESVTWLGIISSIICIIPLFFYNLSEKKHQNYIRALKIRAVVQNYQSNCLSDDDVKELRQIVDLAKEQENEFVLEEISKYAFIDDILNSKSSV